MSISTTAQAILLAQAFSGSGGSGSCPPPGRKRAVNVTLDADVLTEAKAMGINLSQTLETTLRQMIKQAHIKEFSRNNSAAIDSYNKLVTPPVTPP